MLKVVGIRFKKAGKIYYFDPVDTGVEVGDHVIVETVRGLEYGTVVQLGLGGENIVVQPSLQILSTRIICCRIPGSASSHEKDTHFQNVLL